MITRTELLPEQISRYEERSYGSGGSGGRRVEGEGGKRGSHREVGRSLEMMERGGGCGAGAGLKTKLGVGLEDRRGRQGSGAGESRNGAEPGQDEDEEEDSEGGGSHVDHLRRRVSMDGLLLADDTFF
jgi:hypothetical protein